MKPLLTFCLFIFTFITLSSQVVNSGFEEWTGQDQSLQPIAWETEGDAGCPESMMIVARDSNAFEGAFSLRLRAACNFWEGGLAPSIVAQEIEILDPEMVPSAITFWYKMLNLEDINGLVGCAWVEVRHSFVEGGGGYDFWWTQHETEVTEWTQASVPINISDTSKTVDQLVIRIAGGSCGNGIGYEGNSDFLIDGLSSLITGTDEVLVVTNLQMYPNPAADHILIYTLVDYHLDIFTMQGRRLHTAEINGQSDNRIDLSGFPKGTLLLRFSNDKMSFTKLVHHSN